MVHYRDVHGKPHERPADAPVEWRISGYGIVEHDGRLLMVEPVDVRGIWVLPGGGIQLNPEESVLDGIAREVREETGYHFSPDPTTLAFAGEVFYRTLHGRYLRSLLFVARGELSREPDPTWQPPADEIAQVAWIDIGTLRRVDVQWHHWEALAKLGIVHDQS